MKYYSTRNTNLEKSFYEVTMQGLPSDGGLFVPREFPKINLNNLRGLNYDELAFEIINSYSNESVDSESLRNIIINTYKNFHHPKTAPLLQLEENKHILELFYGPTFAFKDYALQFLGNLFEHFLNKENKEITILGATSGDTGSAAVEACRYKKNINVFILYPYEKISEVQRRQMTTITEPNINVIAVKGNFDDCQKIVKELFVDPDLILKTKLAAVNSINWARIIAQTVYYYWAISQLEKESHDINFIVPSGNFGNVYAGRVAKRMGLQINKLHVATNANDALHNIIGRGKMFLKNVKKTITPSMDIQISSNFERQLFESLDCNSNNLSFIIKEFLDKEEYQLEEKIIKDLSNHYKSYSINDDMTIESIKFYYEKYKYIPDPHTATGLNVLEKISNNKGCYISLACAHPSKFSPAILRAIEKEPQYPNSLKNIFEKKEKFTILSNHIKDIKDHIIDNL